MSQRGTLSPAPFAAASLATPVNVIQLDDATQWFAVITLFHDLHDFLLHAPGRVVRYANLPLER
jgi:hypothetical protein